MRTVFIALGLVAATLAVPLADVQETGSLADKWLPSVAYTQQYGSGMYMYRPGGFWGFWKLVKLAKRVRYACALMRIQGEICTATWCIMAKRQLNLFSCYSEAIVLLRSQILVSCYNYVENTV